MKNSAKARMAELVQLLNTYDAAYYGKGISLVPDKEYDTLYHELEALERAYPELVDPSSPTHRIGNDSVNEFKKIEHTVPLLSIDNTYAWEELIAWIERVYKGCKTNDVSFIGELKIDGVACAIRYEKGMLKTATTRGDGFSGDEITANIRTIRSIPLRVAFEHAFEIRGEMYMTFKDFERLNEMLIERGDQPLQNPRNTTAGTIKLLNPAEVARRPLSFAAYSLLSPMHTLSHSENLGFLDSLNIPTVIRSQPMATISEIRRFITLWQEQRHSLAFPVDGVVLKVDVLNQQKMLGATAKSPRWAIAYKYQPETARTTVLSIVAQVGRTGVITPVAQLEPVPLAGTTIRSASLHNYDEIRRLNVAAGDVVEVEKSGEIIPKVITVLHRTSRREADYCRPPAHCPSCGSTLVRLKEEVALRCINNTCPAQRYASLIHFVSRDAMNIEGLGPALLEQLIEKGLVSDPSDLFSLTTDMIVPLEHMGKKSAGNLIAAINRSKGNPLHRLIFGLGIRMIGSQSAKLLASEVNTISDLITMSKQRLCTIDGIGAATAESIYLYFQDGKNRALVQQLCAAGVNCKGTKKTKGSGARTLEGKVLVLTGTLSSMTREQATHAIETKGGRVSASVSAKTYAVIAGADPGSKLSKANSLGVRVLNEAEFISLIDGKESALSA